MRRPAGDDKLSVPVLPRGARLLPLEGAGEVQTPVVLSADAPPLALGDPIFFQHAKGGELAERFNALHLVAGGRIVDTVPTYRGDGYAFISSELDCLVEVRRCGILARGYCRGTLDAYT